MKLPNLIIPAIGLALCAAVTGNPVTQSGVHGGLVAHLGAADGGSTAALRMNDGFVVQGLVTDAGKIAEAREAIRAKGLYGPVAVDGWDGTRLPFAEGVVNLVIDERGSRDLADIKRILAPRGVLMTKAGSGWKKEFVKPVPGDIDDWTHYLHSPGNSNVAQDKVAGSPRRIKWTAGPETLRHHDHLNSLNAIVSSAGRLFYIYDEAPATSIMLPPEWRLVVRDAFSGVLLWKQDIGNWHPHLWPLKSMPATLPRRLVAVGDDVFVTLAIDAPISHLSAVDGSTVKTYAGSERCEEIVVLEDQVLAVCLTGSGPLDDTQREETNFLDGRVTKFPLARKLAAGVVSTKWLGAERRVVAFDRKSGEKQWHFDGHVAPLTLATDGKQVYFHDVERVVALDATTGKRAWKSPKVPIWQNQHSWFGASLVLHEDVVLFAGGENMTWSIGGTPKGATDTMTAFSSTDGSKLWTAPHPPSGYRSPEDLMVVQGLVWAPNSTHKESSTLQGLDPHTGEVVKEFPVDFEHGFHHRCYPGKATENYLMVSKVGINLVDVRDESVDNSQWVRGACGVGFLPANGVIYATPDPCNCYPESKLNGFAALAPKDRVFPAKASEGALSKGSAYGKVAKTMAAWPTSDWPAYRHDGARSGATASRVRPGAKVAWQVEVGSNITAPVVAGGRVYLADIDSYRVESRDAKSGKLAWQCTAGARVDSPPALIPCEGDALCVFGCADGFVTCLRASDGELVWRRRLAPVDERIVSKNGVESVWPVHGAVLYHDGLIHAVAGRSAFVDGGLFFYGLDPFTGEIVASGKRGFADQEIKGMNTEVAATDILSAHGDMLYMRSMALDKDYQPADSKQAHIFSVNGFLDGSWFHRTFWVHGSTFAGGCGGFGKTGNSSVSGRIMVADGDRLYSFGRSKYGWSSAFEYKLFSSPTGAPAAVPAAPPTEGKGKRKKRGAKVAKQKRLWAVDSPVLVRAMVKTGDQLLVAGPKRLYDELTAIQELEDPEVEARVRAQAEAWKDEAELHFVSPDDGKLNGMILLPSLPVWDGVAVADGAMFISGTDGKLRKYD